MVLGHLQHLVVTVGIKVHKVVVDRVLVLTLYNDFVMKVRAGTLARISAECYLFATHHLLSFFHKDFLVEQVGVQCLVAIAVVYDNGLAVA